MTRIRDRIIRALGGHTAAEWQAQLASSRGIRACVKLGAPRRLPIRLRVTRHIPDGWDEQAYRENMARAIAEEMLQTGLIAFRREEGKIAGEALVFPPEE